MSPQASFLPSSLAPDRQQLEDLYRERTLTPFRAGQVIPLLADELVIVCRGVVQVTTVHSSGDEALLALVGSGMPFGLPMTLLEPYLATALTDADVLRLSMKEVEESLVLGQGLLRQLLRRLRQSEALLSLTGKRRVTDRLRHLLGLLAYEFGQSTPAGTRIQVRLTHQHLANAIGTTRVTVTRLLNQFRQQGWLTIDKQRHLVLCLPNVASVD